MKIAISYPPIINGHGQKAMVSQNRNVQYFVKPTYLLPVIHAQAATWLKNDGHDVYWDDGNAQLKTFEGWFEDLVSFSPDVIVLEGTTPVMEFCWRVIDLLRGRLPEVILIITGYHSMRMPEESLLNSSVDVVLRSNHIDFVLRDLVSQIEQKASWRLTANVGGLVIRLKDGTFRFTGEIKQNQRLDMSPIIDRDLVRYKDYAFENGNFLRTPGTYATSVIRDCMFGKCTFCRYNGSDLTFSAMSVERSVDEYEILINKYGVKEIFDDSGVWYRGKDARKFAQLIIDRGLNKRGCYFGFNTRFEYLDRETILLLGKANFRFVLLGYEAADDETLGRLKKGYQLEHVQNCLEWMKEAGLHPHLTIMVGYYWQTLEQLERTVSEVRRLMYSGLARTLQVTLCTPLDYTEYHRECIEKKVLLATRYSDHDMSKLIVRTPIDHKYYYEAVKKIYGIAFSPRYILRQVLFLLNFRVRDWEFLFVYGFRAIRRVRQHIHNLTSQNLG